MSSKRKYTKHHGPLRKLTPWILFLMVYAFGNADALAQQTVKRFILVNNVLMPFTTQIAPSPPAHSSLSAVVENPYKAVVVWSASANTDQYILERLNPTSNQWAVIYQGGATTFTAQDLSVGINTFRLRSCGGGLCGLTGPLVSVDVAELLDTDVDGVLDYTDTCSSTPSGEAVDTNGCSVSQLTDSDGDGVVDAYDVCSGNTASDDVNLVGCTLDQDSDGDGVIDRDDAYPLQHNTQCTD